MWRCDTFLLSSFLFSLSFFAAARIHTWCVSLMENSRRKCFGNVSAKHRKRKRKGDKNKNKTINLSSYKWRKIQISTSTVESFMRIQRIIASSFHTDQNANVSLSHSLILCVRVQVRVFCLRKQRGGDVRCEMLCARKRFFVCCLMQNNVDIRNIYLSGLAAVICATIESLNEKSRAYSLAPSHTIQTYTIYVNDTEFDSLRQTKIYSFSICFEACEGAGGSFERITTITATAAHSEGISISH